MEKTLIGHWKESEAEAEGGGCSVNTEDKGHSSPEWETVKAK